MLDAEVGPAKVPQCIIQQRSIQCEVVNV